MGFVLRRGDGARRREQGLAAGGDAGVLRGNRNLQLLFGGQVVSSFGDWLYVLALGIIAYEIAGSATVVAVLTFARLLPLLRLPPLRRRPE